jgi:hypothetical protein
MWSIACSPRADPWNLRTAEVAGSSLAVVDAGFAKIGLTVCYDLRFPELYGRLCRQPRSTWEAPSNDLFELDTGLGAEVGVRCCCNVIILV